MAEAPPAGPLSSWKVDDLKQYLREQHLPTAGVKAELVERVEHCSDAKFIEEEFELKPFQNFCDDHVCVPHFDSLPRGVWVNEKFPLLEEKDAKMYLTNKGGYTKNYRTGVRLCQCSHLYDLEMAQRERDIYIRAKCRPTMRKTPPYYVQFIILNNSRPQGGNCSCAAGASQSCVHISALLFTLAEITPTACTSVRCAWSRPSTVSTKAGLAKELDFGSASSDGYFPYNGPQPDLKSLLEQLAASNCNPAITIYFRDEKERESMSLMECGDADVLLDPLDKLIAVDNPSVSNLVEALRVNSVEADLLQVMTVGQRDNPVWLDVRQWRITASNFGLVCNRKFRVLYPPSLMKILLGDYGHPRTAAIQWGCDHEDVALDVYQRKMGVEVDVCGIFLSTEFPFLGASPDGLI